MRPEAAPAIRVAAGYLLVYSPQNLFLSIDPTHRVWMTKTAGYSNTNQSDAALPPFLGRGLRTLCVRVPLI